VIVISFSFMLLGLASALTYDRWRVHKIIQRRLRASYAPPTAIAVG
jgi:hypothetical protein